MALSCLHYKLKIHVGGGDEGTSIFSENAAIAVNNTRKLFQNIVCCDFTQPYHKGSEQLLCVCTVLSRSSLFAYRITGSQGVGDYTDRQGMPS